jgi:hypothetical protein
MNRLNRLKPFKTEIILAVLLLLTMIFGLIPILVERLYATGIYLFTSKMLRFLFGWLPFSIGDIGYGLVIILIIYFLYRLVVNMRHKRINRKWWVRQARRSLRLAMAIYLVFQWLWGLNYHRMGSSFQLGIQPGPYNKQELLQLADTLNNRLVVLVTELNAADTFEWKNFGNVRHRCIEDYSKAAKLFPFLTYNQPSVKEMLVGSVGGYGGFSGYLNPFTGEAQLNGNLPGFLRPYVTCHEIGHQLGYAAEEEANMVGYLVGKGSTNPAFRYSVYHDLLTYASYEVKNLDSNAFNTLMARVPPLVKKHRRQARDYYESFHNPLQFLVNQWYDLYLKANSQDKGLKSYSYVTAWLIAYARKYGWQNI